MRTLKPKTIFLFTTSSSSSFFSHLLSSHSPLKKGNFHFSSSSSSSSWKHHDEESRNVRVSVWWDFENCQIPVGVNVVKVAQRITSAIRSNGIKGPITITAFGDVLQLSRSNQEALSSTGICLNHVPRGGKNSADRSLLIDLVYWVSQNPPPAHLLLISGDRDFANILHRLRMSNYNILLASTESAPDVLCSAASIMWSWNNLVRMDSLTGKHFNQPPDGPYGSWYGHYKGPLEDPFSDMEQPASSKLDNSADSSTDAKPRPLPKSLVCRMRQIVNEYPKGVDISEFRAELVKSSVLDKDFFGYKKFSHMLKSLPYVLKLQSTKDGGILVHGIQPKAAGSVESNSKCPTRFETNKEDKDLSAAAELSGGESAMVADATEKSLSPPVDPQKEDLAPVRDASTTLSSSNPVEEGSELSNSNETRCNVPVRLSTTFDGSERTTSKVESADSRSHHPGPLDPNPSSSSNVNKSVLEEKSAKSSGEDDNKPGLSTGFFDKMLNWFGFWRTSTNADHASGEVGKDVNHVSSLAENNESFSKNAEHASGKSGKDESHINCEAENHELFSKNSFWDEMESFVCSPRGSSLISQSRTRLEMAEGLQKEGPSVLNTLNSSVLLHLTDILISEKRWVEECLSQALPFKIIHPARKDLSPNRRCPNGLSAIFSGKSSEDNLQRPSNHEREKEVLIHSKTEVNLYKSNVNLSGKSESRMLTDCQKLVAKILEKHPEGFNMGGFKDLFLEKYGYSLKCRMLGYHKLSDLLQTMPGVTIVSTYVMPSGKSPRDFSMVSVLPNNSTGKLSDSANEFSDSVRNDDDCDSAWEELGPVPVRASLVEPVNQTSICNFLVEGKSTGTIGKYPYQSYKKISPTDETNRRRKGHEYEPVLSDEEFSDSDTESPTKDLQERQGKPRTNEKSSLLQILDSWYTSEEGKSYQDRQKSEYEFVDCSRNDSKHIAPSSSNFGSISLATISGRNTKPRKNYSFVEEKGEDDKGQMIESILGTLQKVRDCRTDVIRERE